MKISLYLGKAAQGRQRVSGRFLGKCLRSAASTAIGLAILSASADVLIEGQMEKASPPAGMTNRLSFVYGIDSNAWISVVSMPRPDQVTVSNTVVTFSDGSEVHELLLPHKTTLVASDSLYPGSHPVHGPGESVPLWLAFSFCPQLAGTGEVDAPGPWQRQVKRRPRTRNDVDYSVEITKCTVAEDTNRCRTVSFWDMRFANCSPQSPLPRPRAQLLANGFTNLGGLSIPRSVEIRLFSYDNRTRGFNENVSGYFRLSVGAVYEGSIQDLLPIDVGKVVVRDRRLNDQIKNGRILSYVVTNEWLPTNSPRIRHLAEVTKRLPRVKQWQVHGSGRMMAVVALVCALVSFPMLWFWHRIRRK